MGVIEEYFKYQAEYEAKYGKRTVVLYQKGSFYNMYEYDPDNSLEPEDPKVGKIGHAVALSVVLNMHLTRGSNKKPYSYMNPHMIGFPCISYDKHRDAILGSEFTIIRIDERKNSSNAVERFVAEIISPATDMRDISTIPLTNTILSIYIECQKIQQYVKFEDYLITCGISCIDVTTGKSIVCEVYSKESDEIYAVHEIYRFITSQSPREIIINVSGLNIEDHDTYKKFLWNTFELNRYSTVAINCGTVPRDYFDINYQKQFLLKVFTFDFNKPKINIISNGINLNIIGSNKPRFTTDNILDELSLDKYNYGRTSYICLLQYCYEHDETIIAKLSLPDTTWIDEDKHLILTHNAIRQLEIFPSSKSFSYGKMGPSKNSDCTESLFSVVDNTSTSLGQRYLINMLSNPITDCDELNYHYDMIDEMMEGDDLLSSIDKNLKGIPDIERYHQKIQLRKIKPSELSQLLKSYMKVVKTFSTLIQADTKHLKSLLLSSEMSNEFNAFLTYTFNLIDIEKLRACRLVDERLEFDESFLNPGQDSLADQYQSHINQYDNLLQSIVEHLNSFLKGTKGKLLELESISPKKDSNGGDSGLALLTTEHKAKVMKKSVDSINVDLCGEIRFITFNKKVLITSDKIEQICLGIQQTRSILKKYLYSKYLEIVDTIASKYKFYGSLNMFVAKLDFIKSNAKTAIKNKYFRPEVIQSTCDNDPSFCYFEDIRHPIVERIIDTEYIANTISLGIDGTSNVSQGIILFGFNGIGKSVITKAVPLNIVLAQACCFTPSKMKFRPYTKIITRLSGDDDMHKGQSSFKVELMEMRTILRNYDHRTLVLGDELCRGTETQSGTGITVAMILFLIKARASFMFSTHMHHLPEIEQIKSIPSSVLRICHLTVSYDKITKSLIYERKLQDGPGQSIYGIEVAKSLNIDPEFIKLANIVRRQVSDMSDELFSTHKSRYNSKVYVDACSICGKEGVKKIKDKTSEMITEAMLPSTMGMKVRPLQTHHIKEQKEADERGFINHTHKNSKFNLVVLCEDCHTHLHRKGMEVQQKQTPCGSFLTLTESKSDDKVETRKSKSVAVN
jgi:DNA mismatch repair protein MutS